MKKVELLSPAGNFKGLIASINAGADAIYLGGRQFGARAYADNFTDEELVDAIKLAHLFGKKIYLTVNTLVKESELDSLILYLEPLVKNKLDGVIVQDFGVIKQINENFLELPIHLSTQLSVSSVNSIELLRKYNVTRVVPARELSLEEIEYIKNNTGIEIEAFIHGAMCYSYSGMCLFSSILGGRSGNRGRCAQPCRLPYGLSPNNNSYPLSMKDMCSVNIINKLIGAGIDSFKIEGRMKKPVYAAGVTSVYRKYIDKVYDGTFESISREDMDFLSKLYLRSQVSYGYYDKHNGKEMITLDSPSYNGGDDNLLSSIEERFINQKPVIKIDCKVRFINGNSLYIEYIKDEISYSVNGPEVMPAINAPITSEKLKEQLGKLGDTYFELNKIDIINSKDGFLPIKVINEYRRQCIQGLMEKLLDNV